MANVPKDYLFTKEHEWVDIDDNIATVGITAFAQESLGDITFVQLPAEGTEVRKDDPFGVVESVKAVSDLYAPVTGRIVEVNEPLLSAPELVNEDPYHDGWMVKIEMKHADQELDELLSPQDYESYIAEQG
jgi:glycine cleavage system H protein